MALVTLRRVRGDPEVIASNGEASAAAGTSARCAACDRATLVPHLALPPADGPDGRDMTPTTDRYGTALADTVRCTSCGHVQLDPLPADGELVHEYEQTESYD